MKKQIKFREWFIAQHGDRPSKLETHELQNNYMAAHYQMTEARHLLEKCNEYDARETSALYAWQAKK